VKATLAVLAAACALSLSSLAAAAPTARSAASGVVPKVVGMRLDTATKALKAKGFRVVQNCGSGYDCLAPKQLWVQAQAPHAGRRFPARTVITIYAALKSR
jgi:beta-lactam-binding protein with PASTA domain